MAERNSNKKPVTFQVDPELNSKSVGKLNKQDFDDAIYSKGYDAYIEKAVKCPCSLKENGESIPNCRNCGGTKYVFINKRLTKIVAQSMNKQTKFLNWSEVDRGTISVTVRSEDSMAFMDRITNINLTSTYSETIRVKKIDNKLIAYTIYPIIVPTEIFLFSSGDKPLKKLVLIDDFEFEDNRLVLNYSKFKSYKTDDLTIAVRYTHFPQYHVIDITRDAVAQNGALSGCEEVNGELEALPIHFVARKAHYVLDEPNFKGESLFDNTYIPDNSLGNLMDSLPFSLDYWITKSSASDIIDALMKEGNLDKINTLQVQQILTNIQDTIDNNSVIILQDSLD